MTDRDKFRPSSGTSSKYHHQQLYDSGFDYTLPRPPALGEERDHSTEWPAPHHQMDRHQRYAHKSSSLKFHYETDDGASERLDKAQMASPACVSWATSLSNLLQDPDGVKLFLKYLETEVPQFAVALHFWFACEGLKKRNPGGKIHKLVKLIYKTYFTKSTLPISDELRKQIMRNMKSPQCLDPPITLFDEAQAQVEYLINNTTYPNFLESDMYLQYLQSTEHPNSDSDEFGSESGSSSSSVSIKDFGHFAGGMGPLPTLHEDMEFNTQLQMPLMATPGTASVSTGYHTPAPRLTKDMLLRSQKHRALDIRPKSETYAGLIYRSTGVHAAYNSYNPVSRQDSEMQSLSSHSDARTESDSISINDSIMDGRHSGRSRYKTLEEKQARQSAARNKETNMNNLFIPRTQRMDVVDKCRPMDFKEHASLLTQKLEKLRQDQDSQELFQRKLRESENVTVEEHDLETLEKLQFQDDNDQDILDEHVSRVFSDHSLSISPSPTSPKVSSPPPVPRGRLSQARTRRREKDVFSNFSGDSGNVHDFADSKSKSAADYAEARFSRAAPCRRSSSKKALTELTDSGVSVVSDSASVGAVPIAKDSRVLSWLLESDRSGRVAATHAHSEMAVARKYGKRYGSRSNSLERSSATGPAQPFTADPGMPPPPLPDTDIQLEEIRRRLTEDDVRTKSRQRSSNKYYTEVPQSNQSTLRKTTRPQRPLLPPTEDVTTVVFSFCDEEFPYRTKIPGSQITLKQFKEYIPKKGNYRFFFKTICEGQVIHEEVNNDAEILPLWEEKIMAQVKPID